MKNRIVFITVVLISAPVLGTPLWAGERPGAGGGPAAPATIDLNLAKAEELALEGNPLIHAADKRVDAASRQKLQTLAPADPVFMVERDGESGGPLNLGGPGTETWMVSEDLGFPGAGLAKVDVDNAETGRRRALSRDTRREILMQARQAFWEFYYRKEVYGLLQDSLKEWKTLSEILKSRELSGQWLSVKAVKAQLEVARATNDFFTASQDLETSRLYFNHLFSLPETTDYRLAGTPSLPPLTGTEEDYAGRALRNPAVEAAQRQLDKAGAEATVAALGHLPTFNLRLMGTRDPNGSGFSGYGVRLGVSFPLFFPFKQSQATAQADDEVSAARYELTGARDKAVHMAEQAYVDAQSAWRLWQLYEQGGLLEQTKRAWKATRAAYRSEQISLPEMIDSYKTYLDTLESYYKAKADYGKALARLNYEAGDWNGKDDSPGNQR